MVPSNLCFSKGVHPIFLKKYFCTLVDHCASSNLCFSANLPPFRADITRQKTVFDKFYSLQNHTLHSARKAKCGHPCCRNTAQSCVMIVSCSVEKNNRKENKVQMRTLHLASILFGQNCNLKVNNVLI